MANIPCPQCRRLLKLPGSVTGQSVACPACRHTFVAPDDPHAAPKPPPPPGWKPRLERASHRRDDEEEEVAPRRPRPVLSFAVDVREDSYGELRGRAGAEVRPEGLAVVRGTKEVVFIPIGSGAAYLEGSELSVRVGGRTLTLAVRHRPGAARRLARDVVAWLNGQVSSLEPADYRVPRSLLLAALLPLGVPLVSMGGWLWIGIGLAAAAVGLALALVDRWSFAARLGFSLTTSALVWTAVLVALVIDPKLLWPPPRVPASAWRVFQPNNLPCRLEMPGRPQERRPQGFQGEALAHWWQVVHQDVGEFVLSHTRVDPIAGPPDPKVLLDEARDGVVATTAGGRLVSEKALTLDGHPGRECLLEMEGGRNLTVRMYLAGHHLFILLAGAGRLPPDAPDIRRFLESFTLVGLDAP